MSIEILLWPTLLIIMLVAMSFFSGEKKKGENSTSKIILKGVDTKVALKVAHKGYDGDTLTITFLFPEEDLSLGIKPGQGIRIHLLGPDGSEIFQTFYPISNCALKGRLTIQDHPSENSESSQTMSNALDTLEVGEDVQISGPIGNFTYEGNLTVSKEGRKDKFSAFSFIASAAHIFPVFQIIVHICEEGFTVPLTLVYYAEAEEDFALDEVITGLAEKKLIKLVKITAEQGFGNNEEEREVTPQLLRDAFPAEKVGQLVVVSGSEEEKESWTKIIRKIGFTQQQLHLY